jgi:REP element-mobilizing transposase RayT
MDRYWLLTWTTYGTWLPGDVRGSVANLIGENQQMQRHNRLGEPYAPSQPGLVAHVKRRMTQPAVWLTSEQAEAVLAQFLETVRHRQWRVCAAAVMANHVHVVMGVDGDPDPERLIGDLKAYATRRLNKWRRQRWWTESGSRRKLPHDQSVLAAVRYTARQQGCLALYLDERFANDAGLRVDANCAGGI